MSFQAIEALFYEAMCLPADERRAMVHSRTEQNPSLRGEVLSLLEAVAAADKSSAVVSHNKMTADSSWAGHPLGVFQIERLLGKGGMGEVYAARRVEGGFDQIVAIKIIAARLQSPTLRRLFLRERDALARLQHPHIAQLLDGGVTEDGSPFLVMEIVGDEELPAERLDGFCDKRDMSARERMRLVLAVSHAVGFAHGKLIVHGDIKPGNVLVATDGTCKLLDFGAAKWLHEPDAGDPVAVTPAFASPEQMLGQSPTVASDIFSMGKLLKHVIGSSSTPEIDAIVARASNPEPAQRYRTMEELTEDLRAWLDHKPVSAFGQSLAYRSRKWIRRQKVAVGAALVVLLVVSVGVTMMRRAARRAEAERVRAQQSADAVEVLAHHLLFDFQGELEDLDAPTDTQHQLATITLQYMDQLTHDEGVPSRKLRLDMATAYARMGDLLGNPYGKNLGRPKEAEDALRKAIATAAALVKEDTRDIEAQFRLAMAQRSLAEVLFGDGEKEQALTEMEQSAHEFQSLTERPDAPEPQLIEAAATFGSLGDVYGLPGNNSLERTTDSAAFYQKQIDMFERVLKTDPGSVRGRRGVALGEFKVANLVNATEPRRALEEYKKALANLDLLPESAQQAAPTVRIRFGVIGHIGDAYFALKEYKEAIPWMQGASDHATKLLAADPLDSRARFDLHLDEMRLGDTYARMGDKRHAREHYSRVLQLLAFLRAREPGNVIYQDHQHETEDKLAALR